MITASDTVSPVEWYCLRAQPRREHIAAVNLRERVGVEVFAPRLKVRRALRSGLVSALAEALFPGYVFARFRYPHQLRHVLSTSGVSGVVSFGAQPPTVADGVIEFLRAQVRLTGADDDAPAFAAGDWVKIVGGCFREVQGRVLAFDSSTARVRVLLSLLGREVQVSVPAQQLISTAAARGELPVGLRATQITAAPVAQ